MARRSASMATLVLGVLALLFGLSTVASADPYSNPTSVSVSTTTPTAGGTITISGTGFEADAAITVTLHSADIPLTDATSNASGDFTATETIPADLSGVHHIVSTDPAGDTSTVTITVEPAVAAAAAATTSGSGSLPFTGADVVGMVAVAAALLGGGAVFLALGRRRRISA